jgi:hypothetical protein
VIKTIRRWALVLLLPGLLLPALARADTGRSLVMASTTSTEQSGLFAHLLPRFTAASGITVKVVALGTGQALDLARRGETVVRHVDAAHPHLSAVGAQQAQHEFDQGGLASPVATEESVDAALGHLQGHRVNGDAGAEAAGEAFGFDGGRHGGGSKTLSLS